MFEKIIVENGQEVEFSETDTLAIFYPSGKMIIGSDLKEQPLTFANTSSIMQASFYYDVKKNIKDGQKVSLSREFEVDGEKVVLTATLVIKKSE